MKTDAEGKQNVGVIQETFWRKIIKAAKEIRTILCLKLRNSSKTYCNHLTTNNRGPSITSVRMTNKKTECEN